MSPTMAKHVGKTTTLSLFPGHPTLRFFLQNTAICISDLLLPVSSIKPVVEAHGWPLGSWPA